VRAGSAGPKRGPIPTVAILFDRAGPVAGAVGGAREVRATVVAEAGVAGRPRGPARRVAAEILDHGTHGRLVPAGDGEAMARAILSANESPVDPERRKARSAEFTVDRALDRYEARLFGDVDAGPSSTSR
jgi:glycosyltransferase involved in cell wall biosynthesis